MASNQGSGRGRGGGGGRGKNGGRGGARNNGNHPGVAAPAATTATTKPTGATVPANWPPGVVYLTVPAYAGISPAQRKMLQTQPGDGADGPQQQQQQRGQRGRPAAAAPLCEVPSIQRFGPSALVEIRTITDPGHPACGQRGLFAARALRPNSFVVPYLGIYHRGHVTIGGGRNESDYDLWLDRAADVAVDAAVAGNEARFVNDYRGTGRPRPNAEFREVWDPRRGERGMAVFVLPAGKRALAAAAGGGGSAAGIAKGDEILVSYGKGFWEMRQKEAREVHHEETQKTQKPVETQDQQPDTLTVVLPDDSHKHKTDEQPLPSPIHISYARAAANAAVR